MTNENDPKPATAKPYPSLKAAAEDKENETVKKETSFQVEPHVIEIEPGFNRPIERWNVEQFKVSIKNGATIPQIFVRVEAGRIFMVDGEHRLIAVKELIAEGMEIPFMSAAHFRGNDADRHAHVLTSAQGAGISPLDQGIKMLDLVRLKWDAAMIARRIGKSITHVENCLMLAESNTDVQQSVRAGDISSTLAVDLIREHASGAGAVIQSELVKVKAKGGKKVTRKSVQGAALPRKLVSRATASIDMLFSRMGSISVERLGQLDDTDNVPVPAGLLKELMAVRDDVEKLRAKAKADAEAAINAQSQEKPGDDASE